MISFKHTGDFKKTFSFLKGTKDLDYQSILNAYGAQGVRALAAATPIDTGETASSWSYSTKITPTVCSVTWHNSNAQDDTPIVVLLHYGHATRQGGYVQGRDFINPALLPIFDEIANVLWKEVKAL